MGKKLAALITITLILLVLLLTFFFIANQPPSSANLLASRLEFTQQEATGFKKYFYFIRPTTTDNPTPSNPATINNQALPAVGNDAQLPIYQPTGPPGTRVFQSINQPFFAALSPGALDDDAHQAVSDYYETCNLPQGEIVTPWWK